MHKIDVVYTWVDDKDENWLKKKAEFDSKALNLNKDANDSCRYFNNDELKYSLRSIEKNIPWINKIFILTDNQKPSWLNCEHEKIRIIDHKDVLPNDKLPLYNACAIENAIPYIEELSEYFIYANDDMLFWNEMSPEFFFEGEKPICRLEKKINKFKKYKHLYGAMIFKAYSLAKTKLKTDIPYFSHHNADSYRKSLFIDCINEFREEFEKTQNNRFRDISDMQRMIVTYYSAYKNCAVLKNIKLSLLDKLKGKTPDSQYFCISSKTLKKIKSSNAKLMCINDCRKTTNEDRKIIKEILEEKFPKKSEFEL